MFGVVEFTIIRHLLAFRLPTACSVDRRHAMVSSLKPARAVIVKVSIFAWFISISSYTRSCHHLVEAIRQHLRSAGEIFLRGSSEKYYLEPELHVQYRQRCRYRRVLTHGEYMLRQYRIHRRSRRFQKEVRCLEDRPRFSITGIVVVLAIEKPQMSTLSLRSTC